jgi:gamma-glutamylaminecyclotransferase
MLYNVFAFGTLKRSFPLHEQGLSGALGIYRTRQRYPMLIAGPWFAPMMFNEPGVGLQVIGELYSVDDFALANLDRLESVGKPGNLRVVIEVEPVEGGSPCSALAYMKAWELAVPVHSEYLTLARAGGFSSRSMASLCGARKSEIRAV